MKGPGILMAKFFFVLKRSKKKFKIPEQGYPT